MIYLYDIRFYKEDEAGDDVLNKNGTLKLFGLKQNSRSSQSIVSEINELVVSYEKNALNVSEIIKFINDQNVKLLDISTDDGDLEDVFIRLTKN